MIAFGLLLTLTIVGAIIGIPEIMAGVDVFTGPVRSLRCTNSPAPSSLRLSLTFRVSRFP